MRRLFAPLLSLLALTLLSAPLHAAASAAKPNIVILFADDLGYGDLGCYGHPTIRTPNLDRMAREGMRFTDFYSAAEVCTPSRAALLTGRYPIRSGMCNDRFRVLRSVSTGHLPESEITLAEQLKGRGYATTIIGKWHLGVWANNPAGHPSRHGFDSNFGLPHSNDMDPVPGGRPQGEDNKDDPDPKYFNSPLWDGDKIIERPADQTTLTRRYTERAVKFIRDHRTGGPFFLYFPHTFPHTPIYASEQFRGKSPRGRYGDVVEEIDWSVGRVLDTLRETGLDQNTLVFFTSDNGPWLIRGGAGGSAGLLRDGKGSTWEGGMREPAIAWWPGRIRAGSVCREIASTMDLFVTGSALAGAPIPADREIDGVNILPLLTGTGTVQRDAYLYYRGTRLFAARLGPWKAHFLTQTGYGVPNPETHTPPLLFNVQSDPGENRNVAADHPDVLAQIAAAVEKHRAKLQPAPTQLEAVIASAAPKKK
ncbi:MAG: sulfatase [Verrucomicrobia bacterium]|nr:sulfatase [Verrucomicrobiota bacterium]